MWLLCRDGAGKLHIVLPTTRKSTVKLECDQVQRRAIRFINNYSLCTRENYSLYPPSTSTHPLTFCQLLLVFFLDSSLLHPPSRYMRSCHDVPRLHSVLCVCRTLPAFYALLRANSLFLIIYMRRSLTHRDILQPIPTYYIPYECEWEG